MTATAEKNTTKNKPARRRPEKRVDLKQIVNENSSIQVSNQLNSIVIFTLKVDGGVEESEFKAQGDPNGEDIMELPSTYLLNARFKDALNKGILKIEEADDEAVLEAYQAQKRAWDAQQQIKQENDRLIDTQQPRAFSGHQCLAQEGRGQCPDFAVYANNNERPPLCQKHAYLATQFVPEETGTFTGGKADIEWRRVTTLGR